MSRPLHIGHVVLSLQPGGLENGVVNVVNGLDTTEFCSSVYCLQQAGEFAARLRSGVDVEVLGLRPGNDLRLPLRLAKLMRARGVDIVHTRNAEAFFYGMIAGKLARVPAVIHSEHGRTFPESRLRALVQRLLLTRVDAAFAVSTQLKNDMVTEIGVRADRFEVLHNGVDIGRFRRAQETDERKPERREVIIGSVGRLVPVKNYGLLLQAMRRLPAEIPARLVLVGEGPERGALERLSQELGLQGRVQFAGHCEDVPRWIRGMDIFVLPSLSEGMSNTLLEAMASGVVGLASDVGGNRELIEPEVSGLLFPSGDVAAAAAQLTRLSSDPSLRSALSRAADTRVRREFSIEAMLQRYATLYRRVWSKVHGEPVSSIPC